LPCGPRLVRSDALNKPKSNRSRLEISVHFSSPFAMRVASAHVRHGPGGHCTHTDGFGTVSATDKERDMPTMPDWVTSFPGAVTVSDRDHRIVYMNDKSAEGYAKDGGRALIGQELMPCHSERSNSILRGILESGGQNVYTIDKAGQKKLIFQSAWRDEAGHVAGLVEVSIVLPPGMPHFVRS
jgi:hypothetical protein